MNLFFVTKIQNKKPQNTIFAVNFNFIDNQREIFFNSLHIQF